ncbi:MAG: hypothetical protein M1835_000777, partial [Candelina submexicana]
MATITGITGNQLLLGTKVCTNNKYQHVSSIDETDHSMNLGLIVQPKKVEDIKLALNYAKTKKIAVARKTG